ncbi:SDR family NAD(P)-dependent oxidoreductase [Novosphingobium panipatense]|uniref:NAD(P)-dependent dehydrogenase, short-chain alcohol dehydrogenase family n=1 Tax=Novosphingobium panipatense TaxID=428991 RepID=A0ABY1Q5W4_9SPHN|nr:MULTISPECIES: SDR family oxidoreductase [Novosphingobium]SMP60844.1 NAD(P)-dependent dehydrogenase, short-chain alcohol dehydrogenase family [Novosphingobium panipatense]
MADLSGKVALVTGAGQGIGQGIAMALANAGAAVAVTGRTQAKLDATCDAVAAAGVEVMGITCDVKDPLALRDLVQQVRAQLGGIDILVNNAQEVPNGKLLDVSDEAFQAGFDSGPLAAFRLMKAVHPIMVERGGGTIINLASSVGVRWDMTGYGAYAAVKQALRSLTRAAAAEWGDVGIRVLTVAPHGKSPGLERWLRDNPEEGAAFFRTIPLRRIGRLVEDIGTAVASLCGDEFSYLTGATIPLDGGQANFD